MLHNVCIIFFQIELRQLSGSFGTSPMAPLPPRLGGNNYFDVAPTTHLAHKLGGWTSQNYSERERGAPRILVGN
jgi:hypothetical protein